MTPNERLLSMLAAQALVCLLALALGLATRRQPAAFRSATRRMMLAAFALAPLAPVAMHGAGAPAVRVSVPVPALEPGSPAAAVQAWQALAAEGGVPATGSPAFASGPPPAPPVPRVRVSDVVAPVWVAGIVVLSCLLIVSAARSRRLIRLSSGSVPDDLAAALAGVARTMGLASPPPLRSSTCVGAPLIAGLRRPMLLLPPGFALDAPGARSVLAHELAHILRRDTLEQALAGVVCALWWWHPGSWAIAASLRRAAEEACDDWAMSMTRERTAYARALVECAQNLTDCAVGIAAARKGGALARRVSAILARGEAELVVLSTRTRAIVGAIAGLAVISCGATRIAGSPARLSLPGPALVSSSDDPYTVQDVDAVLELWASGAHEEALPRIRDAASTGGSVGAMDRLGRLPLRDASEILLALTDGSEKVGVRVHALYALRGAGGMQPSARDRVAAMARGDDDALVRRAAVDLLARDGSTGDRGLFTALALTDPGTAVRVRAVSALAQTGSIAALGFPLAEQLSSRDAETRRLAAAAYVECLAHESGFPIAESLFTDPDPDTRRRLAAVLGRAYGEARKAEWLAAAERLHRDADAQVRDVAALSVLDAGGYAEWEGSVGGIDDRTPAARRHVAMLCRAARLYASRRDGVLPGRDWADFLRRSVGADVYPVRWRPHVAIAMNEALLGRNLADLGDLSGTVMFFEADGVGDGAVAGKDALAHASRYNRTVLIGRADGTADLVPRDQALALIWEPEP
jgi:beta-lactamase regulating signal transducer with metallopeptidase domain/HEAT repeat protein